MMVKKVNVLTLADIPSLTKALQIQIYEIIVFIHH